MRVVDNAIAIAVASFVLLSASNCSEPTEAPPAHPLIGTYDVTTVLDTFSFETGAPSPPDCPGFTLYCTHVRAFMGATLSGMLTIAEDDGVPPIFAPFDATGAFGGQFCDVIDYSMLTGCLHVGAVPLASYATGMLSTNTGFSTDSAFNAHVYVALRPPSFNGAVVRFTGTLAGDSLFGRVSWSSYEARSPPTHRGRFVARRRK